MNSLGKLVLSITLVIILVEHSSAIELRPNDNAYVRKGKTLYRSHCAACHGFNLNGQRNWRKRKADGKLPAPPHNKRGHTWHHSTKDLFALTKFGPKLLLGEDYQTDMPGYRDILSDNEIIFVLSYIKSTWPYHIRKRHDKLSQPHKK